MKRIIAILFLALSSLISYGQGLHFRGSDYSIKNRTSMVIHPRRGFSDSLVLRFDFSPTKENDLGLIFRVGRSVDENSTGGICLYMDSKGEDFQFQIIYEGVRCISELTFPREKVHASKWLPVEFKMDPRRDSVYLKIGDHSASGALEFKGRFKTFLCLGKNEYRLDVPSFDLRKLSVTMDREVIAFPLEEDSGNLASSSSPLIKAKLSNPEWLNQDRMHWKKLHTQHSSLFLTCGYDISHHEVYMISRDSLICFPIGKGSISARKTANINPVKTFLGSSFAYKGGYYAYEAYYDDDVPKDTPTLAFLGRDGRWKSLSCRRFPTQLHHHNIIVDTLRGCHYLYGGFGNQLYNGTFYRLDEDNRWRPAPAMSGDEVWPRYFASAGWDPVTDKIYLFGGMGNESGNHVLGRQYLYDMFAIDPLTFEAEMLWTLPKQEPNRVPVRNMVLPGDECFYTLMYPESNTETELQLYCFSIADGKMQTYADVIPMNSDRILTNANLYYDASLQKLIAVIEESSNDIDSTVSIYTLSFPPLKRSITTVNGVRIQRTVVLLLALLVLGTVVVLTARRRARSRRLKGSIPAAALEPLKPRPNSILLFGGFAAYDSNGNEITTEFPERIRHLLLLILRGGDKGGVSSKRIHAMLWPDKDNEHAKNLRGVTMNKLRKALSGIEGVSIEYEDGYFMLKGREPFFCDYLVFQSILKDKNPDMNMLVRLLSRGKFLLGESDPLFDKMKDDTEQQVQPVIQNEMKRRLDMKEYANAILCADIVFNIDSLDEDALKSKVQAYRLLSREDEARVCYQSFISQYKREYGEDYGISYENL